MFVVIKKQFREFLKTMGFEEDVTEEMIDEMINQMSKMLEFDNIGNSLNIKTGFIVHQLLLRNVAELKQDLEDQLRSGSFSNKLPPLRFQLSKSCLQLNDDFSCSLLKTWNKEQTKCLFMENYASCELARNSIDQGLTDLR